jgi:hypothetical protein
MALDDEHRLSSTKQLEASLADERVVVSMEAASEQGAGSDEENPSDSFASDSGWHVKTRAKAALAGVSYDFRQSTMTKAHVTALESFACYFLKGFARPPGAESVLDHEENEAVPFEDFFVARLRIPPHPILLDILRKFQVQFHQLRQMPSFRSASLFGLLLPVGVILL